MLQHWKGKKLFIALGLIVMLCLLLAACSDDSTPNNATVDRSASSDSNAGDDALDSTSINLNTEGHPIVNEPITLTIMGAKAPIQGAWEELEFFAEMEQRTNIKLEFDTPALDSFNERMNLSFATDSLPDFIFGTANHLTEAKAFEFGSQGFLLPLEDLVEQYAPNVQRLLEENPDFRRSLTSPDGHIYTLPRVEAGFGLYWPKFWINQDWLQDLNMEAPTTIAELYEALKAFKEMDSNIIPMTSMELNDIRAGMMNAYGYILNNQNLFAIKDDQVVFVPRQDEYKAYLEFLARLYEEELLDHETFTQTRQQMQAKGQEQRLGFFFDGASFLTVGNDNNPSYAMLAPLTTEFNSTPIAVQNNPLGYGAFAITKDNQHPEATIRWIDYLFSEDGAILHTFGIEGKHWERTADDGVRRIIPDGMNQAEFFGQNVTPDVGATRTAKDHTYIDDIAQIGEAENNPLNHGIRQEVETKLIPHVQAGFPTLHMTEEEQQRRAILQTDLITYVKEMEAKFVIGVEQLSEWDKYVATLEQMHVEELTALYQQAYDRWNQ